MLRKSNIYSKTLCQGESTLTRKLTMLLGSLLLYSAIGLNTAVAEESADTYFLLNVESDGVPAAGDLVFTNRDAGAGLRVRDLLRPGRAGRRSICCSL